MFEAAVLFAVSLAQQSTDVAAPFLQYGALGGVAVLALLAVRELFKREVAAHDRERARADRLEAEKEALNTLIRDRFVVALAEATTAIADTLAVLKGRGYEPPESGCLHA